MIPLDARRRRRTQLLERLARPALLFAGGEIPRSSPFQTYPYRADSSFLLFFDPPEPGSIALFDPAAGTTTLFIPDRTVETATWMGDAPPFEEVKRRTGVDRVVGLGAFRETLAAELRGRAVDALAVADLQATAAAREITGQDLAFHDAARLGSPALVDAIAALRLRKDPEEVDEIRRASMITRDAHLEVLGAMRPGVSELELAARFEHALSRNGCANAYGTILSVRGEVLHNHAHDGVLEDGDLLLVDAGAEVPTGYGADVTRTWPVSGRYDSEQRAVYEVVLAAQEAAIARVGPGVRFRDVHFEAARTMAEGLVELGLLHGEPTGLVERGAQALFFPHGVGHLLGLDTHDLRIFGDRILYPGRVRSAEFGLDMLRIDLDLAPGMVVTIEPGLYFVPAILRRKEFRARFSDCCDFERAERYLARNRGRGFGGVRIEDDILVTPTGGENLTPDVPKSIDEIERRAGREAAGALAPR
jgi:Xaa-Pro aminopeptidase